MYQFNSLCEFLSHFETWFGCLHPQQVCYFSELSASSDTVLHTPLNLVESLRRAACFPVEVKIINTNGLHEVMGLAEGEAFRCGLPKIEGCL